MNLYVNLPVKKLMWYFVLFQFVYFIIYIYIGVIKKEKEKGRYTKKYARSPLHHLILNSL